MLQYWYFAYIGLNKAYHKLSLSCFKILKNMISRKLKICLPFSKIYFIKMYVCVCVNAPTLVYSYPQSPEENIGSPETGVTGSCELLDISAGNQAYIPVFCKVSKSSWSLNDLSSPLSYILYCWEMITGQSKMRGQLYFSSVTLWCHSRFIFAHTIPTHKDKRHRGLQYRT